MCPTFANTVSPMKCHFPTSHTCMPDFTFLYGGIVGQDFENISIEEKDVLSAVEVSSKVLKTFWREEKQTRDPARIKGSFVVMRENEQAGSHWTELQAWATCNSILPLGYIQQPDNYQPSQSSMCTAQVVLNVPVTHLAATQFGA